MKHKLLCRRYKHIYSLNIVGRRLALSGGGGLYLFDIINATTASPITTLNGCHDTRISSSIKKSFYFMNGLLLIDPPCTYQQVARNHNVFISSGIAGETHEDSNSFMTIPDPITQYRTSDYTFTTMAHSGGIFTNYLQIVAASSSKNQMRLDGANIAGSWTSMATVAYSVKVQ